MAALTSSLRTVTPGCSTRTHARSYPRLVAGLPTSFARASGAPAGLADSIVPLGGRRAEAQVCHVVVKSRAERSDQEIEKILFTTEQLNEVLDEMGRTIGHEYQDKGLLILGVLKGGFVFTADLVRHLNPVPKSVEVDFLKVHSYGLGMNTSGRVQLDETFDFSVVKDKHVLVAEDIIDTGLTMSTVVKRLRKAGAMSVRVAVLLDKRARRSVCMEADYVGIQCPDEFVVGYGIDFADRYRWLPYIGVPKPEVVAAIKAERVKQMEEERVRLEKQVRARAEEAAGLAASQLLAISNGHPSPALANGVLSTKGLLSKVANGVAVANGHISSNGHGGSTAVLTRPARGQ